MDEKSSSRYPHLGYPTPPPAYESSLSSRQKMSSVCRDRSCRRTLFLAVSAAVLWFLFWHHPPTPPILDAHDDHAAFFKDAAAKSAKEAEISLGMPGTSGSKKVPLEAHIMSKCPDAKRCLQDLIVPAMETVSDKVDFNLSYIGELDPNSDAVSCMHGPPECLGNMILLCAAQLFPPPILSLGFANCMIGDYQKIPQRDHVESCALEHGISFEKINDCISEEGRGLDLLRDSVQRSQDAGVKKSCTVRVAGEKRCIMDGGEWKDCEMGHKPADLIKEVERLYTEGHT